MAPVSSSSVRRIPCKTDVANETIVCRTRPELFNNRRTTGHEGAKLFRLYHSNFRQGFQGSQRLGVLTPVVMRIFVQKPSTLLILPVIDFHQRLHVAQSAPWVLVNFGARRFVDCQSINALHFGDPSKSNGLSVLKYSHKLACMSRSQQLRDMSKRSPGVRSTVSGWLNISAM